MTTAYKPTLGEIVGMHLKHAKANWTLDGEKLKTGPDGFTFTALPGTGVWGRQLWSDHRPIEQEIQRYIDGRPDYEKVPEGWTAFTGLNGLTLGCEVMTFTGSFGARATVKNLFTQYQFRGCRQFPVVYLDSKPRGDEFENIDPVFKFSSWVNALDFANVLPPEMIEVAPLITTDSAPPRAITKREPQRVEARREEAPPPTDDDARGGPNWDDDVPFMSEWR
jgi:hypothetical protein